MTTSYEERFDDYYRTEWRHDAGVRGEDLLLDHYPYSVRVRLPQGGWWLELGVGTGRVVWYHRRTLQERGATCVGVDTSPAAVDRLRRTLGGVPLHAVRGDIHRLPFAPGSFDCITLFGTLQAVDRDRRIDAVAEMTDLLADGGRLGFSVHPPSLLELIRCLASPRDFRNITSGRWLRRELGRRRLAFTLEKHRVFVIPKKLLSLLGMRLPVWFGFSEFRSGRLTRAATWLFRRCLPFLTFGHWWVWVEKPAPAPTKEVPG